LRDLLAEKFRTPGCGMANTACLNAKFFELRGSNAPQRDHALTPKQIEKRAQDR
jgi:hypothetical protein